MLQWARAKGCPWDEGTCAEAVRGEQLEVLRWVRDNGCPWNHTTAMDAEALGYLAGGLISVTED